ncbi:MAG: FHA domain-containing protein, partial [Planctomycetota bacterium]
MTEQIGDDTPSIRFESIAGPPIDPISIAADQAALFGRSSGCDRQLTDKTVSRRHCRIARRGESWFIADLDSRHGTYLNGVRLDAESPAPLADGDLVRIGPWTLRTRLGDQRGTSMPTTNDLATTSHRVQRVPERELRSVAEQRFDLLVECAAAINSATAVPELAERVLDAVGEGTGFTRAAFIRQVSASGDVEVIAYRAPDGRSRGSDPDASATFGGVAPHRHQEHHADDPSATVKPPFTFSRSLINAAADGQVVRMQQDSSPSDYGESVIHLGIMSAMCAPVMLGGGVEAYVYLDARGATESAKSDAAAFCQAIARMAGLALGNLKRVELEKAQTRIAADLR